jgi:hypothetical protein
MTVVAALITLDPPALDEAMIMAIATRTSEPIRPSSPLQSSYCFAEAQGLHIALRCRRSAGIQAAKGLSGTGCRLAPGVYWYPHTSL